MPNRLSHSNNEMFEHLFALQAPLAILQGASSSFTLLDCLLLLPCILSPISFLHSGCLLKHIVHVSSTIISSHTLSQDTNKLNINRIKQCEYISLPRYHLITS